MEKKTIITTSGKVEMKNNQWVIVPDMSSKDIRPLHFTDRYPYDCAVIRHDSKYGIFYVSDMTPHYYGNINPPLVSFDKDDPFPYDEVRIKGVDIQEIMMIGYRIGDYWGIDSIYFDIKKQTLGRNSLVSCTFSTLLEAESFCLSWNSPF